MSNTIEYEGSKKKCKRCKDNWATRRGSLGYKFLCEACYWAMGGQ